ncbi:BREX system P-loop protein BrxC [Noviherbaspirillum sp. UKPF54]|uniref:BREX system P-loop protein BrxC n=1 Tax=Noviherbaspirillum sp. UKPF54 TaxID=2601898 RepID=UPI0011B171BE|nr:BREX system P-loop protein BrxC [Noviherbaspirillum sp. UKPF54]QDZ26590.1 BREX system P-loop protein BrxC [Noviherbaspirillum sp. UKPF54]
MLNRDIYNKPPKENRLVNNGVAEVSEDHSDAAQAILRYELETFVCDGQYEKGLETILDKFLLNLDAGSEQPGVWISGFYGSGKSHLAKMLRTLWTDYQFADGATARSLAKLPTGVFEHLKELSTQGKRHGALHAAAGKLGAGAGDKVRLALLGIVFKSKGLPEQYNQAQFVLWMTREGILPTVEGELQSAGRSLAQELPHMYVSSHLAKALLKARPDLAHTEADARKLLKEQFPQVTDITSEQMTTSIDAALSVDGKFPLTLVVLDEVQQYIGADAEKAFQVQEVTETLSKHFNGKLLFVGTGQSALSGMPNLQRLMGRFPVQVMLGDWDVENVTRQIILAKKPTALPEVEHICRANLGEISRQLRGTKLEHVTDDEDVMTADYPLLPVRRRFWERVLRTIDTTGTVSQLRSQLRVVHEAVLATADVPLGHVVSGDFLYDQISANLVSTAQLPKEVFENVQRFAVGDVDSQLKARLLKLVYLINKLPADTALDIGLKATEDALADLLVTDLSAGSSELRKKLPALLEELQNKDRLVMALAGSGGIEYRLQTRESSAWYDEFRAQEAVLKASPQLVEQKRTNLLKTRFAEVLKKVRVVQGKDNVERRLTPTFDDTLPKDHDKTLYLWIQDGWQTEEKSVIAEAKAKSADNPTLFAFLPAQHKTELANAIVALEAAHNTLQKKGSPSTEEGRDAQRSMESRQRTAEKELAELLDQLFGGVRVFQSGGQEATDGNDLTDRINRAAKASAIRLYSQFDAADHDQWSKVLDEARKGNLEALKAVGHTQEADKHPVCQKLLAYIGPGKKGSEIRDNFDVPPYGWPRDAIDGALYALLAAGHIKAQDVTSKPVDARSLDRAKLTQASFQRESVNITPPQLIKIRTLFSTVGVPCQPKEELAKVPTLLNKLRDQAKAAGGVAPAPEPPKPTALDDIAGQSGNAQLLELYNRHDDIVALFKAWTQTADAIAKRLPIWHQLSTLLRHAKDLGPYVALKAEADAIETQRSLLADPDPVRPLLDKAVDLLRQALNGKLDAFQSAFNQQRAQLHADADWNKLTDAQRAELTATHHLMPPAPVQLATPEQLQDALDDCDLDHWVSKTQALPSRFEAARLAAVQLLKPNVVHVAIPRRTLNDEAELKAWLTEVEALVVEKLRRGPVAL